MRRDETEQSEAPRHSQPLTAPHSPGQELEVGRAESPQGAEGFCLPDLSSHFCVPITHIVPSKILSEARKGMEAGLISILEEQERGFIG